MLKEAASLIIASRISTAINRNVGATTANIVNKKVCIHLNTYYLLNYRMFKENIIKIIFQQLFVNLAF